MIHAGVNVEADHLCVLVHGLLGSPENMSNIAGALRTRFTSNQLHILLARCNIGSLTYDGIDRGGERLCKEVEEHLAYLKGEGQSAKKLSMIGYSFGGLVLRYAVGLLYARGVLDNIDCMNFVTFATPHLGVRTCMRGWRNFVWDTLGSRAFSVSGRQLFLIDEFRHTGRPLLKVLADSRSIFMSGIRKFTRHTLYANIVNDRSVAYYTASIEQRDFFTDTRGIRLNYLPGYDEVILDPKEPVKLACENRLASQRELLVRPSESSESLLRFFTTTIIFPVEVAGFLFISAFHTTLSSFRMTLLAASSGGIGETMGSDTSFLESIQTPKVTVQEVLPIGEITRDCLRLPTYAKNSLKESDTPPIRPYLILNWGQVGMAEALDDLKWRKYRVRIQGTRHSHAAIIMRGDMSKLDKPDFAEGQTVLKHFVDEEFLL